MTIATRPHRIADAIRAAELFCESREAYRMARHFVRYARNQDDLGRRFALASANSWRLVARTLRNSALTFRELSRLK